MRIEHHLLRLARVGSHERHPAVTQPDMGDFDCRRHSIDQDNLMAPVELIGLARIEAQRNIGAGRCFLRRLRPVGRIAPDGIITTGIAAVAQLFINPDQCQALALRAFSVVSQHLVKGRAPGVNLWSWLDRPIVRELSRVRSDDLAHSVPRNAQFPADLLDRLVLNEIRAPDLRDRLHNQHPLTAPSFF